MRFLVTRLRFLGDIVLSTPLLDELRERFPEASIEYLASAPFAGILADHPSVDRVHTLPARAGLGDLLATVRELRSGPRIDWAFDLFSNPRSALLVALSGARNRVGSARGLRSRVYQHRRRRPPGDRSAIRHHLDKLVPLLGETPAPRAPRLVVERERGNAVARELGLEPGAYALLHPGSTWPDKAWPTERWPSLVQRLDRTGVGRIAVVAPPGQSAVARAAAVGAATLLPELSLPDLAAVISRARLYIGNDGGAMHMAVALQIPTVALFGPTEPDIWFPYESFGPYRVLHACGPERRDETGGPRSRLGAIGVEAVHEAALDALSRAAKENR